MTIKALIPIANGTEEMEAVILIDVLRRAGADVVVASVNDLTVTASRGVRLTADCQIEACTDTIFDLVALPGGMPGAEHLRDSIALKQILVGQKAAGRMFAAICASPAVVLESHGLLSGHRATCYPSYIRELSGPKEPDAPVVVDGNCITSQGPGTAMEFSLILVELLFDRQVRDQVASAMIYT